MIWVKMILFFLYKYGFNIEVLVVELNKDIGVIIFFNIF